MEDIDLIAKLHQILSPLLDEKSRRLMTAAELRVIGQGGIGIVSINVAKQMLANLSAELKFKGFNLSHKIVGEIFKKKGFSLQPNRKTDEGESHPDRNAQFEYIHLRVNDFQANGQSVISVYAKKKELVGNFKNNGKEWHKKKF
jgi:hypothetical protein